MTVGVPHETGAGGLGTARRRGDEAARVEVTVLREEDGAPRVEAGVGFGVREAVGAQHLGLETERPGVVGDARLVLEARLGAAYHEAARELEAEVVGVRREVDVERAGGHVEVAQDGRAPLDVRRGAAAPEGPAPAREVHVEARLDVERPLGVAHPAQALRHDAGRGQRHDVARREQAGVAERRREALRRVAVDHRHVVAGAGGVERRTDAATPPPRMTTRFMGRSGKFSAPVTNPDSNSTSFPRRRDPSPRGRRSQSIDCPEMLDSRLRGNDGVGGTASCERT